MIQNTEKKPSLETTAVTLNEEVKGHLMLDGTRVRPVKWRPLVRCFEIWTMIFQTRTK